MSFADSLRNIVTTESTSKTPLNSVQKYDPFSDFYPTLPDCIDSKCSKDVRVLQVETSTPTFGINDTVAEEGRNEIFAEDIGVLKLREEPWVPPLIGLSSLNILIIVAFEIFVIYKAFRTIPSRRHLFLGQVLLLGLFISSAVGFAFVPNVNWVSCVFTRVGLGIGYTIVFGTLLVKTVFLLSLHSGTYLPVTYQAFLLFFVVATQVAIDVQWLLHNIPAVINVTINEYRVAINDTSLSKSVKMMCNHKVSSLLYSLMYNIFLILLVLFVSLKIRGHRENFREALFIVISIFCTVIIWVIWFLGVIVSPHSTQDAFIGYGSVVNSLIIFVVMFVPKARQLAALGHECGYYHEDRDDTDSPDSLYAPSFVHLKPSLLPLMGSHKSNSNWNFYKQFNGGTQNLHQVSPRPPTKPIAGDRILYMSPTAGPPPPGSRVWRSTFPSYGNSSHHGANKALGYSYETSTNHLHQNQKLKFFRAPVY